MPYLVRAGGFWSTGKRTNERTNVWPIEIVGLCRARNIYIVFMRESFVQSQHNPNHRHQTDIHIYPSVGDRLHYSIAFHISLRGKMQRASSTTNSIHIYTTYTKKKLGRVQRDTSDKQFLSNYFSFILINGREFNLNANKWTNDVFWIFSVSSEREKNSNVWNE